MRKTIFFILILLISAAGSVTAQDKLIIARVKYSGGGDWYNDPAAIPNLLDFINRETGIPVATTEKKVALTDEKLFSYPILFLTGHGRIRFNEIEVKRLREFLNYGGFLYADDDYGMDKYFHAVMKKVLPKAKFIELPFSHPIYHIHFDFPGGPPKIHEHDGGPARAYGLFLNGRMVVYYTFDTNISDGWVATHNDPPKIREEAFKMGANIMLWNLMN
ncbi:MAG TPA: DUF4159 domain-containing protein [Bacteroidetes bacterium]|nr:DUF4159 domain-containing protein [Bacteroidota bacterium]